MLYDQNISIWGGWNIYRVHGNQIHLRHLYYTHIKAPAGDERTTNLFVFFNSTKSKTSTILSFPFFGLETVVKLRGIQSRGNPAEKKKDSDWNQS